MHAIYVRPNGAVVVLVVGVVGVAGGAAVGDGKPPPATRPSSSWTTAMWLLLPRFTVPAVHLAFVWFFRHHDTTRAPSHTPPDHQLLRSPLYANALLLLLMPLLLLLRVNANFADLHANVACTNIEVYCQSCRHSRWRVACPC